MITFLQMLLSPVRIGGSAVHLSQKGISLARRVIEELVDDLDGEAASETITFSYRGADYEVDLSEKNAAGFDAALAPYIAAARKVRARRAPRAATPARTVVNAPNPREVREWAKRNNVAVSDRGRVPAAVVRQYQDAQRK